jgi:hypothetical protein
MRELGIVIMALFLRIGQAVKGAKDVYGVAQKLHDNVCSTRSVHLSIHPQSSEFTKPKFSSTLHRQVVLKCAPDVRLEREKEILQQFEGDACVYQATRRPCQKTTMSNLGASRVRYAEII